MRDSFKEMSHQLLIDNTLCRLFCIMYVTRRDLQCYLSSLKW